MVLLQQVVEVAQDGSVALADECDGSAFVARATGTADAVDVVVDVGGQVIVENDADVGDVEAARGDVGSYEHWAASNAEHVQRLLALPLRAVSVDGRGLDALVLQCVLERVCASLGLYKDEREALARGEDLHQPVDLLAVPAPAVLHLLRDEVGGAAHSADCEEDVVLQKVLRQALDLFGERGAEHQRLSLLLRHVRAGDDLSDLRLEPHVQHAVGLIEDEELDHRQRDAASLEEVDQAAGSGHEDVAPPLDLPQLIADVLAAVHHHRLEPGAVHKLARLVVDLSGQLARGSQHQRRGAGAATAEAAASLLRGLAQVQIVREDGADEREEEGSRLACNTQHSTSTTPLSVRVPGGDGVG